MVPPDGPTTTFKVLIAPRLGHLLGSDRDFPAVCPICHSKCIEKPRQHMRGQLRVQLLHRKRHVGWNLREYRHQSACSNKAIETFSASASNPFITYVRRQEQIFAAYLELARRSDVE